MDIRNILIRHWGYSEFRSPQEEIILSVLEGKDTLALMPTGGGKSICFQVPGMAKEGLCLVVTPLIALMKDQVQHLVSKGIKAEAVYSGMHSREISMAYDNCAYGQVKFLYLSPERLLTEQFRLVLPKMRVNLLAVDEAHCISQWGYDFRPPYLQIREIRSFIPGVPVLALTATATPRVVTDILDKLGFPARNVFQKSFERKNLTYLVIREEDKLGRMTRILKKVQGPSIVYVRNRKKSGEIAALLNRSGIRSTFYHAGLDMKTRESRQVSWMKEEHRVMIATNAFGMGIDKPNVRLVLHLDLPDSPEAYFQEAGRGGRDGKRSYAVVLFNEADLAQAGQNLSREFPPLDSIRIVYKSLANELKIPAGSGKDESYDFDLSTVAKRSGLSSIISFNCLRLLEKEGYIRLNEATGAPSRICFSCGREDLYRYQVENIEMDRFIKVILRSYSGVFTAFVPVNEKEIAQRSGLSPEEVVRRLDLLRKKGLMDYIKQTDKPQVIFTVERLDDRHIRISPENYKVRKNIAREKMQSMLDYVTGDRVCRSQFLLDYFGEKSSARCGKCDVCRQRNKLSLNEVEFDRIHESVIRLLNERSMTLPEIVFYTRPFSEDEVLKVVRWLEDHGAVVKDEKMNYALQRQFRIKI